MSSIELIEQPTTALRSLQIPALGAIWPEQGGIYAGIVRGNGSTPDHHLIVCADPSGNLKDLPWGEYGKDVTGASSKSDGAANTRAMAEAGSEAAKAVRALDIAGFTDWHIGSQADMHIAFANCAEAFDKDDWYWTSTQLSRDLAFIQDFEHGYSYWNGKGSGYRVRAVRTIQLEPLTA
jgi:hypothetical protein